MSFGRFLQGLAPIAAGAMAGPGGWAALAAGAATGACIAALNNEDILTGAAMGGMSGWGGKGIGEAMRGTATLGATDVGKIGIQGGGPGAYSGTAPTLGEGFSASMKAPGKFLSNFGGGARFDGNKMITESEAAKKGAARLGAVGLPAIGQGLIPEYNVNPDDDPMAKYDPRRRLNLGMTTGIQNALTRDSGLRLNQPFAEGGYLEPMSRGITTLSENVGKFFPKNIKDFKDRAIALTKVPQKYSFLKAGETEKFMREHKDAIKDMSPKEQHTYFEDLMGKDLSREETQGYMEEMDLYLNKTPPSLLDPIFDMDGSFRYFKPSVPPVDESLYGKFASKGMAQGGYIEDRMYPLGPTGEFGLPRHPKFDELTDEEINYFFETDEAEVLNRMDLDQEHRERMQDYIDRYDRNFQEGGYLETGGRIGDGMSDDINATIEGGQPARLSDGEFVVPADVVSHLGNGSSDAGAEQLYAMMDRIREARTGTEEQGREISAERFLPA